MKTSITTDRIQIIKNLKYPDTYGTYTMNIIDTGNIIDTRNSIDIRNIIDIMDTEST